MAHGASMFCTLAWLLVLILRCDRTSAFAVSVSTRENVVFRPIGQEEVSASSSQFRQKRKDGHAARNGRPTTVAAPTTLPYWAIQQEHSARQRMDNQPKRVVPTNNDDKKANRGKPSTPSWTSRIQYQEPITLTEDDDIKSNESTPTTTTAVHEEDDGFRWLRQKLPVSWQYFLRDSGLLGALVDTLTVVTFPPALLQRYPTAGSDFLRLTFPAFFAQQKEQQTTTFQRFQYNPSNRACVVDVMAPTKAQMPLHHRRLPLMIFVHGGAWGSGFPAMYRLVAQTFLSSTSSKKAIKSTVGSTAGQEDTESLLPTDAAVAVVGYSPYPRGEVTEQVTHIQQAIRFLHDKYGSDYDLFVVGHSSGAHISLLALLLQDRVAMDNVGDLISGWIGLSGVYDIPKHYLYEKTRGVERFSPLSQACRSPTDRVALTGWKFFSPTRLLREAVRNIAGLLPNSTTTTTTARIGWKCASLQSIPPLLVCHGVNDTTVPVQSSSDLVEAWRKLPLGVRSAKSTVDWVASPKTAHVDTVLHLMFGGSTRETVKDWITMIQSKFDMSTNHDEMSRPSSLKAKPFFLSLVE